MADVKPLKLVDHGDGAGRLEEFGAADKVPAENLPATEWTAETVPQAEAEAGTAQTRRAWTSQRVRQAIAAWWNGSGAKTQLDAVSSGITSLQASKLDATANLTALSGLAGAADRLPYFTGAGALSLTTLTALARNLLDDTTQSEMQSTLGLVKQTSATDTTAGALMAVGAFGLGASIGGPTETIDANTLVVSRTIQTSGASTNLPESGDGAVVTHKQWASSDAAYQTYHRLNVTYERFKWGSVWGAWVRIYTAGNILGTVSQSGGVPTGAIIERGSNANGEYVRWADGTQICFLTFPDLVIAANGIAGVVGKNYPATFVGNAPSISVGATPNMTGDFFGFVYEASRSLHLCVPVFRNGAHDQTVAVISVTAFGRWF